MIDFLRTAVFWTLFAIFMILSIVLFVPFGILKLVRSERALKRFTRWTTSVWGRFCFFAAGCKLEVEGLENLPEDDKLIFISNHQAYADIPFLMSVLPTTIGFIAKKEIRRVPLVGTWAKALHCIFIDRRNFRSAMRYIEIGIEEAKQGYPKVIFPEGTRSRSEKMAAFKPGGVLLAAKAGITVVPLTINGAYKTFEEKNRVQPARLSLKVHPPIDTSRLDEEQKKNLSEQLWKIVAEGLPNKGE